MVAKAPGKKRKPRLAAELNVKTGDLLLIEGGKGIARIEIPRHLRVKRLRPKQGE